MKGHEGGNCIRGHLGGWDRPAVVGIAVGRASVSGSHEGHEVHTKSTKGDGDDEGNCNFNCNCN